MAGLLHFTFLDRPALWIDEASTYRRVAGTYRELLGELRHDGFGPLHYQAYWLLGRRVPLTPDVMRWLPALAATLFVPAVYALARQLVHPRAALTAAGLAACSACVYVYGRDAKMYMCGWLFVAAHVAAFLWWLRTRSATAWLTAVAGGVAMAGTLPIALAVVAVQPLLVLTAPRVTWRTGVAALLGMSIVAAGPLGHHLFFTDFLDRVAVAGERAAGIDWVSNRNADATGPDLVLDSASCFLLGFQWLNESRWGTQPDQIRTVMTVACWAVFGVLALGLFPWSRRLRGERVFADDREGDGLLDTTRGRAAGLPDAYEAARSAISSPQSAIRTLHLLLLVVLPTYGIYCRSVAGFAGPLDWLRAAETWTAGLTGVPFLGLYALGGALLTLAAIRPLRPWVVPVLRTLGVVVAVLVVMWGLHAVMTRAAATAVADGRVWRSVFVPRYVGMVLPFVLVGAAALLTRLPTRPVRWAALALILAINLVQGTARVWAGNEPPINDVAADVYTTPADGSVRVYLDLPHTFGGPGFGSLQGVVGRYYAVAFGHPVDDPFRFVNGWGGRYPRHVRTDTTPDAGMAERLASDAKVSRVIVWSSTGPTEREPGSTGNVMTDAGWALATERRHVVRVYWTWTELGRWYRREYVRTDVQSPTTTAPAASTD